MNTFKSIHCFQFLVLLAISACKPNANQEVSLREKVVETFATCGGNYAMAFIDLTDGDTMFIAASKRFHAASTMKVPVMIEVFKKAREGVFSLEDSIDMVNEFKSIVDGSTYQLSLDDDSDQDSYSNIGKRSTIFDLVYDMITISSNLATNILIELVGAKEVTQTMRTLGANDIEVLRGVEDNLAYDKGLSNSTTAMDLAIIFKALAENETGTREDCQSMVQILKEQKFNEIIPAYLPPDVVVAHKTGSITALHHDAGIVFLPSGRSYVLVLLSEQMEDFDRCTEMLALVSSLVYDFEVAK